MASEVLPDITTAMPKKPGITLVLTSAMIRARALLCVHSVQTGFVWSVYRCREWAAVSGQEPTWTIKPPLKEETKLQGDVVEAHATALNWTDNFLSIRERPSRLKHLTEICLCYVNAQESICSKLQGHTSPLWYCQGRWKRSAKGSFQQAQRQRKWQPGHRAPLMSSKRKRTRVVVVGGMEQGC